ncbi:MAG TPA: hypothetical protein VKM93_28955 [Terriglobia bacterium]|nr:hypothetical protein [Terriglobia bacterium]
MWQVFEYPLNPFSKRRHVLTTGLLPEECLARLAERLSSGESESGDSAGSGWEIGVEGSTGPSGFAIHRESSLRNHFQTEALGRFIPTNEGTRIEVEFGSRRGARLFAMVALAFSGFISVALVLRWRHDSISQWSGYSLPIAVLFPPFIYGYLTASRWLSRNEGPHLLRWLRDLLEAAELDEA